MNSYRSLNGPDRVHGMCAKRKQSVPDVETPKQEVIAAENAFAAMVAGEDVPASFMHFAADEYSR